MIGAAACVFVCCSYDCLTSPAESETSTGVSTKFVPVIEFVRKYLDRVVTSSDSFADHGQNKLTFEVNFTGVTWERGGGDFVHNNKY